MSVRKHNMSDDGFECTAYEHPRRQIPAEAAQQQCDYANCARNAPSCYVVNCSCPCTCTCGAEDALDTLLEPYALDQSDKFNHIWQGMITAEQAKLG